MWFRGLLSIELYIRLLLAAGMIVLLSACGSHESERFGGLQPAQAQKPMPTPLEELKVAIVRRDLRRVRELVPAKVGLETDLGEGRTPLLEAARAGATRIVRMLVDSGADLRRADSAGRTARDLAADFPAVTKILVPELEFQDRTLLREAISLGQPKEVRTLLARNTATYFQFVEDQQTPLTLAVTLNRELVVRELVRHQPGAEADLDNAVDVRQANGRGETPLAIARALALKRIEKLLLAAGAEGGM